MRISDWSSDVCSSDLGCFATPGMAPIIAGYSVCPIIATDDFFILPAFEFRARQLLQEENICPEKLYAHFSSTRMRRSEEHTSELQSLMRISYAVFCLNKTILNI